MATQLRGASNARAKADLGWQPTLPSWREGFATALDGAPAD
jgi:2-alkyl-3-oxoalkanoate reductase